MATYTADEDVFLTILLHAAKYPSCSVNGLLLGSKAGQGFHITAVMPLFHSASLTLAPCVETGLAQVCASLPRAAAGMDAGCPPRSLRPPPRLAPHFTLSC